MKTSVVKTCPWQKDATIILLMWHPNKVRFKDISRITYTDIKSNSSITGSYITQPTFTCSKLTIEALEQGQKYVQC